MKIAVRIPNWIGDAILSVPFINYLKSIYPNADLFLVGRYAPLQVYVNFPNVKELIVIDDKNNGIIKTGLSLRKYNFDIFYILADSLSSAVIAFLSSAKKRYGYRKEGRCVFLSKSLKLPDFKIHRAVKYLNILKINNNISTPDSLTSNIYLTNQEIKQGKNILNNVIHDRSRKIIGINPNCSAESRKWPFEKFAALADILSEKFNVIFFGSKDETEFVKSLIDRCKKKSSGYIINLAGMITIREYIAVLKNLDLFITNDSGPMHLANAVFTPVIALEGPADINETGALNKDAYIKYISKQLECSPCVKNICPLGHNNCMKLISVDEVVAAVSNFFD